MNRKFTMLPGLLLVAATVEADPVVEETTWTKSWPVTSDAPSLTIDNIWGNVRVRSGNADEIVVRVHERRSAPTQAMFLLSKEVLDLEISSAANSLALLVGGAERDWRDTNRCRDCRVDIQFEVTVPAGTQLDVATVIDGRVDIDGVTGSISAGNVNGPITIAGSQSCADVSNINGSIEIGFANAPISNCEIDTINGDVILDLPDPAGLDLALNMVNGKVVSAFEVSAIDVPARVDQFTDNGRNRYRIEKAAGLRVGTGGPTFSIHSMNGDIRIQQNL